MSTFQVPKSAQSIQQSQNKLLAGLPMEDYQRLAPYLQSVPMTLNQRLQRQDEPIQYIFFPTAGACSLVKSLHSGHAAEVATVGREGAVGTSVFFGQRFAECDVVVQVPAPAAEVLTADAFTREMELRGAFYNRVIRYNQALVGQIMQTSACNGLHSAEQRCARWLLMTHDRAGSDEFALTHESLATMLGVRRPTVTLVLTELAHAGIVSHTRGRMRIVDRHALESAACECYLAVKRSTERLLPELATSVM